MRRMTHNLAGLMVAMMVGTVGISTPAQANPAMECFPASPQLLNRTNQLDRLVHDLAEGVDRAYARHPWAGRLTRETRALEHATHRFVQTVQTNSTPQFLQAEIRNVCDQFQRTRQMITAVGLTGGVRGDLSRVDSAIERLEKDLQPVRVQPFPNRGNGPGNWGSGPGNRGRDEDRFYGRPVLGQPNLGQPNLGHPGNVWNPGQNWNPGTPLNGGFVPNPGRGSLNHPGNFDSRDLGQRPPSSIGFEFGDVRFSIPVR